jgi:hypothetical protein
MKRLLSITALALALGMPSAMLAQTTTTPERATQSQTADVPGFLTERGQSDLFASELMGHEVHTRRDAANGAASETGTMATVTQADLDQTDSIGQINNLVLPHDGQVRAIVIIDFGGFLGMGSHQVSLRFDDLKILSNDRSTETRIEVDATKEQIQSLPQYQAMN